MRFSSLLGLGVLIVALGGCGSGTGDQPPVESIAGKGDRSPGIEDRKREIDRRKAAVEKQEDAAAQAKTDAVGGNLKVNRMLARLDGQAGLVAGPPGAGAPDLSGGSLKAGDAWSTIKVPIAERVLSDAGGPNRLDPLQRDEINRAITLSDNAAAASLFQGLEQAHGGLAGASRAVGETLRRAGDRKTVISTVGRDGFTTYGQTDWSLREQYRYMAALSGGCLANPASSRFLLGQMAAAGGSDIFGLGAAGFPASWKGGWGPGTDGRYLVRQMGTMDVNGREIVLAMAAIPDDGSFESGQAMLSHIARWSAAHLSEYVSGPTGC